jgi:hypothetical protein
MSAYDSYAATVDSDARRRRAPRPVMTLARRTTSPSWRLLLAAALLALALGAALHAFPASDTSNSPAQSPGFARQGLLSLPAAARGPASAAIGAGAPAYRIGPDRRGLAASNPAQRLRLGFSAAGVSVYAGATRVELRLGGIGYGSSLAPIGAISPTASVNRVRYAHPGVQEWYANGPLGLEQGFTVERAPAGRFAGALTLAIALSGNATAALARGAQSVVLSHRGAPSLRYTGLSVSDARGRSLPSWFSVAGHKLLLHVDTAGARYPLRIDPFVQQGEKLSVTNSGDSCGCALGTSVALSADGNTALIGGPEDNGHEGAAWVFTRTAGKWAQQAEFGDNGQFGAARLGARVALSADGNTALIGGPSDNGEVGAAWVFTRSGGVWTQGPKLTGGEEIEKAQFGSSVALSSDGNTALIGGALDNNKAFGLGAAWVFTRTGSEWAQQGKKLTGGIEEAGAGVFGFSVALSSDGNTALIGAPNDSPFEVFRAGAVFVFTRSGSTWSHQGKVLTGGEGESGFFGTSVAASADGNTALIGATGGGFQEEPAFVFTRSSSVWSEQAQFKGTGETGEANFGASAALTADGNTALIGGGESNGSAATGSVWVFQRSSGAWSQQGAKLTGSGAGGESAMGESVAISSEGSTALAGGPGDATSGGAAWVFVNSPTLHTAPASEVTASAAKLSATVNPDGQNVTECKFEYGTSTTYTHTAPCSPSSPGSGEKPVIVSASVGSLSSHTVYHFRIVAKNAAGANQGADETLTTLNASETGETPEATKPAVATLPGGALSATALGSKGSITVGNYKEETIGGSPLFTSVATEKYVSLYTNAGSTFQTIEFKDCELGGGKAVWWDNPNTGWEPIREPPAHYDEATKCVTVTLTETTTPSVAEMTSSTTGRPVPRFGGGQNPGPQEFGKCEPAKKAFYTTSGCTALSEKGGEVVKKGKFEWYPAPAECFAKKKGLYADEGCQTTEEKKGKPKGKYEKANSASFTGSGGAATLTIVGQSAAIKCATSSLEGRLTTAITGRATIIFGDCEQGANKCFNSNPGAAPEPRIATSSLEALVYERGGKYFTEFGAKPFVAITCGNSTFKLSGFVSGERSGAINALVTSSTSKFGEGLGTQALATEGQTSPNVTFATELTTTVAQGAELRTER